METSAGAADERREARVEERVELNAASVIAADGADDDAPDAASALLPAGLSRVGSLVERAMR